MGIERIFVSSILLCVCVLGNAIHHEESKSYGVDSHIIEISSLLPFSASSSSSSPCVPSPKASKSKSSLHVVHAHGACSHLNSGSGGVKTAIPDRVEILRRDQARVASIHTRLSKTTTTATATTTANADRVRQRNSANLPAKDGSTIGSGNYIVTVGIGTPKKDLSLIFDTGSDLTWTQCQPCVRTCYSQKEAIFDPSSSSSYNNVSCSSPVCAALSSATGNGGSCSSSTCVYGIQYGDQSFSVGFFAKEKITLTSTDAFDGIYFGCGENNQGLFNGAAGLLGLGRDKLSFPSQTASRYNKVFSYCLPSSASTTGHLTFGPVGISRSVRFTPLSSSADGSSFYGLDIVGISVAGQVLSVSSTVFSSAGSLIDSGTVITRLPPKAYSALRSAFKARMSKYTTAPGVSILDTCYDLSGLTTVTIPKVGFLFSGGVDVELDATGILYAFKVSQVCLAFASNSDDSSVAIFGNVQQQTLEVVYDGAGGRVGFGPGGCK